jgi:phosphatidylinositol alpha-1,6-mannosyltransferase
MRLLLLTIDFPPARGGVQTMLGQLALALASSCEIMVVTPAQAGDARWDARQPYAVRRSSASSRRVGRMTGIHAHALLEVARRRPDVVVCGHVLLGPVCRLLSAVVRVPYVAIAYAYEARAPRRRSIAGLTLRGARHVVALSDFGRDVVRSHGVAESAVSVIHPGVSPCLARVDVRPGGEGSAGSDAGQSGSPSPAGAERIVLTVGRLVDDYKGHDMVVRAMPLILARVPEARYVVVGDGPLRHSLERLARALDVAHAVRFVGEVSDAELDRWYRASEVFVLAARETAADGGAEGFGIACVEASARGVPVVGGCSGGIPDAVIDGRTGLLVDPLDSGEIAEAVIRLLTEPALASRLGREGRRRAREELTWPRAADRFAEILARVASG